jgi:hypothetical protein
MKQLLTSLLLLLISGSAQAFDHSHSAWDSLLERHVVLISDGNASQLDYTGVQADRDVLQDYLESLSAITEAEYRAGAGPNAWPF